VRARQTGIRLHCRLRLLFYFARSTDRSQHGRLVQLRLGVIRLQPDALLESFPVKLILRETRVRLATPAAA
jgi:hypothetical protein